MNTRAGLYANEAVKLLDTVSAYTTLYTQQLLRLFPAGKADTIRTLLRRFAKERRLYLSKDETVVSADPKFPLNDGLIRAFWVLLDFIDRAGFHVPGVFPALISFFAGEELYDILHIPWGQEAMIRAAIPRRENNPPKRILLLDDLSQMPALHIPNTAGYCLASRDGKVTYYQ